jgi:hypothetical protein
MHNLYCDIQGIPQHLYVTEYTAERGKPFFSPRHTTEQMTKLQFKHRSICTIFRDTDTTHIYNKQNILEKMLSWCSVDNLTFIYTIAPSWFPDQQMLGSNKFDHLTPFS